MDRTDAVLPGGVPGAVRRNEQHHPRVVRSLAACPRRTRKPGAHRVCAVFVPCSYAVVCIAGIVASVLGAGENYFGWSLGIAESISAVIVIGFSVDCAYCALRVRRDSTRTQLTRDACVCCRRGAPGSHVRGQRRARPRRARDARGDDHGCDGGGGCCDHNGSWRRHAAVPNDVLHKGRLPCCGGGLSAMRLPHSRAVCAARLCLQMAWLIVLTIFFSFLTALGLFMALCALAGPQGNVGSITEMAKACWKKLK